MSTTETRSAMWAARDWGQALVPYRRASAARGILELTVTFPPFAAVWTVLAEALERVRAHHHRHRPVKKR